jgi:hypothetical protein
MNRSILGLAKHVSNLNINALRFYAGPKGAVGGGKLGGGISSKIF